MVETTESGATSGEKIQKAAGEVGAYPQESHLQDVEGVGGKN